jgi:hypothetical protein
MEFVGAAADGTPVRYRDRKRLQRHSDHHANALRPYQTLRNFEDLPRLPSGYPGSFGLAAFPSQWFKVMDPKLMRWAGGELAKVNVDPSRKDRLYAKYAAPGAAGAAHRAAQLERRFAQRRSPPA